MAEKLVKTKTVEVIFDRRLSHDKVVFFLKEYDYFIVGVCHRAYRVKGEAVCILSQ